MSFNPLELVIDEPLEVDEALLCGISSFKASAKFELLPGVDTSDERARLSKILDDLTDRLISEISSHPRKFWVMEQFQHALIAVQYEDTEGREHFGIELERLMDVLRIESSSGLLNYYLVGI